MGLDFDKVKLDAFGDMEDDFGGDSTGFWGNLMGGVKAGAGVYGQWTAMQEQQKIKAENYIISRINGVMKEVDIWDNASVTNATEVMDKIGASKGNWASMPRVTEHYVTQRKLLMGDIANRKTHVQMMNEIQEDGPGGMYHPKQFITGGGGKWGDITGQPLLDKFDEAIAYYNTKLTDVAKLDLDQSVLVATNQGITDKILEIEKAKGYWGASEDFKYSEYVKSVGGRSLDQAYSDQSQLVYNTTNRINVLTREIDKLEALQMSGGSTDIMWEQRKQNLAVFRAEKQVLQSKQPSQIGEQQALKYEMDGSGGNLNTGGSDPFGLFTKPATNTQPSIKNVPIIPNPADTSQVDTSSIQTSQFIKLNHTVTANDTLQSIADSNDVHINSILQFNPTLNPNDPLVTGDTLIVPVDSNTISSNIKVYNAKTDTMEDKKLTNYEKQVKAQIQKNILNTPPADDSTKTPEADIVTKKGHIKHKSFDSVEKAIDDEIAAEVVDGKRVGDYGRTSRNFRYGLSKATKDKLIEKYSKRFVQQLQTYYSTKERYGVKPEQVAKAREKFVKYYESWFKMDNKKLKNMSKDELQRYIDSME